jgi:hypothetical protein
MQSPFPFESMLVFGCLAIMLLTGVLLRAKIAFFQHFLIPNRTLPRFGQWSRVVELEYRYNPAGFSRAHDSCSRAYPGIKILGQS